MVTFNHPGLICKRARENFSSIDINDMARSIGYGSKAERQHDVQKYVRNFEKGEFVLPEDKFERYLRQLDLNPYATRTLKNIYYSYKTKIKDEARLGHYSFEYVTNHRNFPELSPMVNMLIELNQPAMIVDDLYYVHAMNGAMVELYQIKENHLQKPEAWHSVVVKYQADKKHPIIQAHPKYHEYFYDQEIGRFFGSTNQFFFTSQYQNLIKFACKFSPKWFANDWKKLVLLTQIPKEPELVRPFRYRDKHIQITFVHNEEVEIYPVKNKEKEHTLRYKLVELRPCGENADEISKQINENKSNKPVFAVNYVKDYTVNDWCNLLQKNE